MRVLTFLLTGFMLGLIGGCESQNGQSSLVEELEGLKQKRKELSLQLKESESENKQLKEQIATLAGLGPEVKLGNLYKLQSVKISSFTNFYDKDKDGKKEKLIVYIQPIDQDGDIVKAAGNVEVQLWSLDNKAENALLGDWDIGAKELRKLWYATMMTINYRLMFDVDPSIGESKDSLTVKIAFTDYLTGKVFKEQRAIKRQLTLTEVQFENAKIKSQNAKLRYPP